ncbi:four-carbon acid sugar kinase family protein [Ornithinimicrobium faecis]|uniref:3-oxo-tetronate kinase n=1 Tax=Ornithinimicrobium faecis TaxID=2934158 RepID=A0ABY4YRF4_9MICO|nr:3-oxo-tetronate kinase [Ornithinimicrobium sp. HY1793]USQ79174.1 four-carbon acid sugar kinase family protein [Ornithinimicrobium sp. HY1793]
MSAHVRRGAVADDFTGATDLAGNWTARGLRTSVLLGLPDDASAEDLTEDDAVVVALKTRSASTDLALDQSVRAGRFLREWGAEQLYDKYCSTFDSTPEGNIGPVADALLELTGASRAVVVPSFPDNGRTVYQGHLFVGDEPLHESPMKDHPLNPMWDSSVPRLLTPQTQHQVGLVPLQVVHQGPDAVRAALAEHEQDGRRLIVVDAVTNEDLAVISTATQDEPLVTGGSGLALGLPARDREPRVLSRVPGRRVVLSGSASRATQQQVASARKVLPHAQLDVAAYTENPEAEVSRLLDLTQVAWQSDPDRAVLIYSVGAPDDVTAARALGDDVSQRIETAFASLATALSSAGASEFIVAGGETSGAVLESLGVRRLEVGQQLSPGVSWLAGTTADGRRHNFVLKSGNFGTEDLFVAGWEGLT